jgi:hypothetical protein
VSEATQSLIERFLGVWGRALLHFYEANAAVINGLALLYGVVLYVSWDNLRRIRERMVKAVVDQLQERTDIAPKTDPHALLEQVTLPWDEAIAQSRFPLVARHWAFFPRRLSRQTVESLLQADDVVAEALETITGAKPDIRTRRLRDR